MSKQYFYTGSYRVILMLILFGIGFYYTANAQDIQVGARLDKNSILIGDQTVLHLTARIPTKSIIAFPELKDSIGKIKIVKSGKLDTVLDKNNPANETITHNYTITSFDTGVYVIPELEFQSKEGTFKTGTVTLQVKPVLVDTTKAFYDIKQPFAVNYNFWDWLKDHWKLVLVILVGILLIAGIIYYLKNRPEVAIIIKKTAPVLPLDVITINKLQELRDKKLWQQNEIKLHYIELTDILREYLEKRYHINTQEQTTAEIFEGLKNKDLSVDARNKLKQLLSLADLVKFAKERPAPAESEQSIEDAIAFVKLTRQEVKPIDAKEEGTE